ADMSRFPSPGHLASWVGVCPGSYESAGKRRRVATTNGNPWLRRALIQSARAAVRTKGSYFGAQYRQIARHRGPNKAAVAVAHSLIALVWHLLSTGEVYKDLGDDYFASREDPDRRARRLVAQLEQLGFKVILETAPGFGWITSFTVACEIADISRFSSPVKLTGYTGLCPRVKQSGQMDQRGPLSKHGPRYLRWGLMEAAIAASSHPLYRERYQRTRRRLGRQRGPKVAQIDLARQLTEAIWYMLTRNQPFAPQAPLFVW